VTAGATLPEAPIADRVSAEIERAIRRNVKGIEYLSSPAPATGQTPKDVIYKRGTDSKTTHCGKPSGSKRPSGMAAEQQQIA
jgi:hypothetical protein